MSRKLQGVRRMRDNLQKIRTIARERILISYMNISVLPVREVGRIQIRTGEIMVTSKGVMVSTYPVRISSSSTPYIFACQVPHPSSQRRGTILAKRPRKVGLR